MKAWRITAKKWGLKPPISHFKNTWKTAALMSEKRRPITALLKSQKLRMRICMHAMTAMGTTLARNAAGQMGMMFLRSGYANCG